MHADIDDVIRYTNILAYDASRVVRRVECGAVRVYGAVRWRNVVLSSPLSSSLPPSLSFLVSLDARLTVSVLSGPFFTNLC